MLSGTEAENRRADGQLYHLKSLQDHLSSEYVECRLRYAHILLRTFEGAGWWIEGVVEPLPIEILRGQMFDPTWW